MRTVWFENGAVCLVDQTRLPLETVMIACETTDALAEAIRALRIRGAPAIGVAAAYGIAQAAAQASSLPG